MKTVLDLFAGAGGFSIGFALAGYKIKYAIDNAQIVQETFEYNHPDTEFILADITELDPNEFSDVDVVIGSPPCLPKEEKILTRQGEKCISNINIGDEVFTHKGEFNRVTKVYKRKYSGELYKIYIKYFPKPLIVTPNHPILCMKRTKDWNNGIRSYEHNFTYFDFLKAKHLTKNFMIGFPINKIENEFDNWKIERKINQHSSEWRYMNLPFDDVKFWFFIGFYLAEGWYRNDRNVVYISANDDEFETIKSLIERINLPISYVEDVKGKSQKIHIHNLDLWNFVKIFNKGARNKKIPISIENLKKKYLKAMLMGWVFGDGCYAKNKTFSGVTTSFSMAKSFQRIGMKVFGYIPSLSLHNSPEKSEIEGRIVNQHTTYTLRFNKRKEHNNLTYNYKGCKFIKIRKIEKVKASDIYVYNLEIENNHSYCKHLFATHNCQSFSNANKNRDPDKGMELVNVYRKWIEVIQPEKWIMENVPQVAKHISPLDYPVIEILNSANYGVPQTRKRCFAGEYGIPEPTHIESVYEGCEREPWITVWEALRDIIFIEPEQDVDMREYMKTSQWRRMHPFLKLDEPSSAVTTKDDKLVIPNHEDIRWKDIAEQTNKKFMKLHPALKFNEPSRTVIKGCYKDGYKHPNFRVEIPNHICFDNIKEDRDTGMFYKREIKQDEPSPTVDCRWRCNNLIKVWNPRSFNCTAYKPDNEINKPNQAITCSPPKFVMQQKYTDAINNKEYEIDKPSKVIRQIPFKWLDGEKLRQKENGEASFAKYRRLTVRETARLQSFPDWFIFLGSKSAQYKMVGNCYSDDTEILTKEDGWILFKDLTKVHKVACLSPDTHTMYWHKPSAIQKYHYEGDMILTNHRSIKLLITPNHRMYMRKRWKNNYEFIRADECKKWSFLHTINHIDWKGDEKEFFNLPKISYPKMATNIFEKSKIKMDDWLRFLGWYIAEGYTNKTRSGKYRIRICQTKKENLEEIKEVIKNVGYNFSYDGREFTICNKQLGSYLENLGNRAWKKHIPQEFMNLSKRQLKILFDALIKGDGHITKNEKISYYTSSKKLANQIQEIGIKLGYVSNIRSRLRNIKKIHRSFELIFAKSKESVFANTSSNHYFKKIDYNGHVYCCTVPEHIILIRRKGRPVWCGNSVPPLMAYHLAKNLYKENEQQGDILKI